MTEPAFRSEQAATESDPFAAVYEADDVPFSEPGSGRCSWSPAWAATWWRRRPPCRSAPARRSPRWARRPRPSRRTPPPRTAAPRRSTRQADLGPARRLLRRRGRQEARGAALRHAAALPVARLRPGGRHRPAAAEKYGDRWSSSTRRSTWTTTPTRGCASRCGASSSDGAVAVHRLEERHDRRAARGVLRAQGVRARGARRPMGGAPAADRVRPDPGR